MIYFHLKGNSYNLKEFSGNVNQSQQKIRDGKKRGKGKKRIEKKQKSDITNKKLPRKIKYYHKPQPMQKMAEKETKIKFCFLIQHDISSYPTTLVIIIVNCITNSKQRKLLTI